MVIFNSYVHVYQRVSFYPVSIQTISGTFRSWSCWRVRTSSISWPRAAASWKKSRWWAWWGRWNMWFPLLNVTLIQWIGEENLNTGNGLAVEFIKLSCNKKQCCFKPIHWNLFQWFGWPNTYHGHPWSIIMISHPARQANGEGSYLGIAEMARCSQPWVLCWYPIVRQRHVSEIHQPARTLDVGWVSWWRRDPQIRVGV